MGLGIGPTWRMRLLRAICLPFLVAVVITAAASVAGGHGMPGMSLAAILSLSFAVTVHTVLIRKLTPAHGRQLLIEPVLRLCAGRRHPDYARIRELEIECELTEPERRGTRVYGLGAPWPPLQVTGQGGWREATAYDRYGHPYDRGSVVSYVKDNEQR